MRLVLINKFNYLKISLLMAEQRNTRFYPSYGYGSFNQSTLSYPYTSYGSFGLNTYSSYNYPREWLGYGRPYGYPLTSSFVPPHPTTVPEIKHE